MLRRSFFSFLCLPFANFSTQESCVEHGDDKYFSINGKVIRIEKVDGTKRWYQNGKLHRIDNPAIEYTNGTKYWFQNGKLHRVDGPAIEYPNGTKFWLQNGEYCTNSLDGLNEMSYSITRCDAIANII